MNNTVYHASDLDINYDEYMWLQLEIERLEELIERMDDEMDLLYSKVGDFKQYAKKMGTLAWFSMFMSFFFIIFYGWLHWEKIKKDVILESGEKGGLLHRNLAGEEDDFIRFDNSELAGNKEKRLPRDFEFQDRDKYWSEKDSGGKEHHLDEKLRDKTKKEANELMYGMIEEVEKILRSGIPRERFDLFGMEYKHIAAYLDGTVSYGEMKHNLQQAIHQLAKRQATWFRGMERRGIVTHWIDRADPEQAREVVRRAGLFPA